MDQIISVFRPCTDSIPEVDIVHSRKFGWTLVTNRGLGEPPVFINSRRALLVVLADLCFDVAGGETARETAASARQMMAPYLAQLPPDCTEVADTALGLLAKLDD